LGGVHNRLDWASVDALMIPVLDCSDGSNIHREETCLPFCLMVKLRLVPSLANKASAGAFLGERRRGTK
jgi:hypothetical protein